MKTKILIFSILIVGILISIWTWYSFKNNSVPEFTGTWAREVGEDAEFITFNEDGHFAYYGSEGNGINDYDLCDSYTYDKKSKVLKINCANVGEDTPTNIQVVSFEENTLILKFNNEEKTFMSKKAFDEMLKGKRREN